MAQFYRTLGGSYSTVKVLSTTSYIDVEAIPIETVPHGVRLTVLVPLEEWQDGNADTYLNPPAELVEELLGTGGSGPGLVSAIVQVQAQDSSRLIAYFLNVTVTYVSPNPQQQPFSATISLPMTAFETLEAYNSPMANGQKPDEAIQSTYEQLKATASL